MTTKYSQCIETGHKERLKQSSFNVLRAVFPAYPNEVMPTESAGSIFPRFGASPSEPGIPSKKKESYRQFWISGRRLTSGNMPRGLPRGNRSSGDPRGCVPLVAGRGSMPRPRKGGRERSDHWKGETRSGFPLQVDSGERIGYRMIG